MIYYYAICGSRSHGIELPTSDYDVVYCGINTPPQLRQRSHNIVLSNEKLVQNLLMRYTMSYNMQLYFPAEILQDTDVVHYLISYREQILRSQAKKIYESYMGYCDYFLQRDMQYYRWRKNAVYSCLYCNILHRYATQDISFDEAFHPQGDFKEWLMAVRRNEISDDEVLRVFNSHRVKAQSCVDFYKDKLDQSILNKTLLDLNDLLGTSVKMTFNR